MSSPLPVPERATCPQHPQVAASWTCGRCGSFMCPECERRVRPEAVPMCPGCWELRSRVVPPLRPESRTTLQTVGLVLGVISLVPGCFVVQLASVVVNLIALVRAREPQARAARWRPAVGLCLTVLGFLLPFLIDW